MSTPLQDGNRPSLVELLPKLPVSMVAERIEELERENVELRIQLRDMTDQFFAVSQENAALRTDKERLRWLYKNDASVIFEPGDPDVGFFPVWMVYGKNAAPLAIEADFFAAIDAARTQGGAS